VLKSHEQAADVPAGEPRVEAARPPASVCAAFGSASTPAALVGGRGTSWRVDAVVLKPLDGRPDALEWEATVLPHIRQDGFRVAWPLRALDGRFIVDGWTAATYLAGRHEPSRWPEIVAVGERLHRALAHLPRPAFLDRDDSPWGVGDRVAWGDEPPGRFLDYPHIARLVSLLAPVDAPSQVVHGDLTGNVLFADGDDPAIIDWALYWRPAGFGAAIVVGDALSWEGADESLLESVAHIPQIEQLLLRALIYRIVTDAAFRNGNPGEDTFGSAVEIACSFAQAVGRA
jgi:uncharacterized protein (TIGR02569 family)